jgi:ketosteroid isomerase-like protein
LAAQVVIRNSLDIAPPCESNAPAGDPIPRQQQAQFLETPMKKMWIWSLFILLSAVSLGWSQTGSAEKAVAAQEQLWLQSQKANNPDQVAPLLSDKIVITLPDGTVHDKADTLATAKKTKYDSVSYTGVKVTVFGNAAIATGGFDGKGTDENGKAFDVHERWTDTWVMTGGKWLCVASADVPAKK